MKNVFYKATVILIIFLSACNDDSMTEEVLLYWDQTKCSDPWDTGENNTNNETVIAIKTYLEDQNIVIGEVIFDNASPLFTGCESCGCGTGQRIIVAVTNSYLSEMENLGFYQ